MKMRIATTALIAIAMPFMAAASALTEQADSAYSADRFDEAAALYRKVMATEGVSAPLYYNLGNAEYRLGHPGQAILNYERALRLDPTFDEARQNLAFVNERITDRQGERGTFVGNALDAAANQASSDTWAWLALTAFVITCVLAGLYIFTTDVRMRKAGFFGGLCTLTVTALMIFFSSRAASIACDHTKAIVTAQSTILSTTPRQPRSRSEEAMLLHEGTSLRIVDSVRSVADSVPTMWLDVEIDNTHRAWVNARDVERVR